MTEKVIPAGQRIRVALLGCGRISKNHFEALAKLPGSGKGGGVATPAAGVP